LWYYGKVAANLGCFQNGIESKDMDASAGRLQLGSHHSEQSGFARPVWSNQAEDLIRL
jgi:hypothetical protein